jgi:DNA-binding beta-propeller fold protein YncE
MPRRTRAFALTVSAGLLCAATAVAGSNYKLIKTIDLPGSKGGHGDWVAYDSPSKTVWLAQSPDNNIVVVDVASMSVKATISGVANANGIATSANYAFAADPDNNLLVVIDKNTLKTVASLKPQGKTPDGVVYDPDTDQVYVTCDDSNDTTVFSGKPPFAQVAHIQLQPNPDKDGPDVAVYVGAKKRIFQPVHNVINVIDPATNTVAAVWKPDVKKDIKPMVYDSKTNHLFVGTTDKKMLVLDADTGALVASFALKGAVDETDIDEAARRAYVGDKAGNIEVVDLDANKVIDFLPSEKNVHTLAVDTDTHDIYVYRNESNKLDVFRMNATM